jgi:hypothetical protein
MISANSQDTTWQLHWVGRKLECISCGEKIYYASDDLTRCLFVAPTGEIGIKERIEFFTGTTGDIRITGTKWYFE